MKYLLRERLRESQPFFLRCKELLNQVFQSKPETIPGSLDDFIAGLSPETLLKLERVQGGLKTKWESAPTVVTCNPTQGPSSDWMRASKQTVAVTRPKIRVQLRRAETPELELPISQKSAEVRGLDDIFPERVTSFFGDEKQKPRQQAKGSVVIDYRIVKNEPKPTVQEVQPVKSAFKGFDESWRKKVRWPITSKKQRQVTSMKAPAMVPRKPLQQKLASPVKTAVADPLISWSATFWSMMSVKIADTLAQMKPVLTALEEQPYVEPEMTPVSASTTQARIIQASAYDVPKPTWHVKPLHQQAASEMQIMTGMDVREFQRPVSKNATPEVQAVSEAEAEQVNVPQEVEAPIQRLDATLLVSKHRKPFSQVPKENVSKPVVDQAPMVKPVVAKKADSNNQDAHHLDYMWRNNQILAKSIMNLADQYFQQAALEESASF